MLYCFGALTLALLLALATLAALRQHRGIAPRFRAVHRATASVALLSAAAHWWPFALLLCPAVAVGATGAAVAARVRGPNDIPALAPSLAAALAAALAPALAPALALDIGQAGSSPSPNPNPNPNPATLT